MPDDLCQTGQNWTLLQHTCVLSTHGSHRHCARLPFMTAHMQPCTHSINTRALALGSHGSGQRGCTQLWRWRDTPCLQILCRQRMAWVVGPLHIWLLAHFTYGCLQQQNCCTRVPLCTADPAAAAALGTKATQSTHKNDNSGPTRIPGSARGDAACVCSSTGGSGAQHHATTAHALGQHDKINTLASQ